MYHTTILYFNSHHLMLLSDHAPLFLDYDYNIYLLSVNCYWYILCNYFIFYL